MITATIQNSPYCTEMTFPCTETELLKKLEEIGIAKDHLAPTGMVIDIEPDRRVGTEKYYQPHFQSSALHFDKRYE